MKGLGRPQLVGALTIVIALIAALWALTRPPAVDLGRLPEPDLREMPGRVARLLTELRGAVLETPSSSSAWGDYCLALDAHRLYEEAGACYEVVIELEPEEFLWRYHRAIALRLDGADRKLTLEALEQARRLDPRYPTLYYFIGTVQTELGNMDEATEAFRRVTELAPQAAFGHLGLGEALVSAGDLEAGLASLERANEIAPGVKRTLSGLARAHQLRGDSERAKELAALAQEGAVDKVPDLLRPKLEALSVDPNNEMDRAIDRMAVDDYEGAIPFILLALEDRPDDARILHHLGQCYAETGRTELAIERLRQAVAIEPDLGLAQVLLGNLLAGSGRHAEAAAAYRAALAERPDEALVHARLGTALGRSGDLAGARVELQRAVELGDSDVGTFRNLGSAYMRSSEWERAIPLFERALEAGGPEPTVLTQLARCLERSGRLDEAIARYRSAAALDPAGAAAQRLRELGASPR